MLDKIISGFASLWKDIKAKKIEILLGICAILVAFYLEMQRTPPEKNDQWAAIDGDTIKSSIRNQVHLYGIDAPELNQSCHTDNKEWPCGRQSKQELQIFIENKKIVCQFKSKDRYKRNVEDCAVNGKSISEYMVENGWAVAYTRYSDKYLPAELKAKKNKLGVWGADCFIRPERWRRGDRCRN